MGALKDGSPTSLNKWELLKMGTLPSEKEKGCDLFAAFYIMGENNL